MIYEIKMPSLGADMDKGRFIEWKVKVGDHVNKDQEIAVIETPKAAVEVDSFRAGKIVEIIAKPDEVYPVGSVLAKMELDFVESGLTDSMGVPEKSSLKEATVTELKMQSVSEPPILRKRQRVSPAARKLAEQEGVDLNQIQGSGPEGVIELQDIQKQIQMRASVSTVPTGESLITIREAIARTMSRSKKEIPHYYLRSKVCIDPLIETLDKINSTPTTQDRILMPAALMHILALALKKHTDMNGYYENEKFVPHSEINMGMAIALKTGGVIAPAVLGMESLDLIAVNGALKDLILRSREGKLKASELSMGTITVTNLGDLGCHEVFGVIFPPQVALIGLGQIRKEAVVDNNIVKPGFVIDITLSADHRVSDGLSGSRFLQTVSEYIAQPHLVLKS